MKLLKMLGFILVVAAVLVAGCTTAEPPEATPAPTEPPEATPAPTEPPEATPAPTEPPEATPAPTEPPEATPAPTEPPEATPAPTEPPEATPAPTQTPAMKNIVETAQDAGSFSTLLAAVDAAGLTETLSGEGPFTVFAPTDDAFAALPEGTLDTLLEDPEGQLTDILLYHVADGRYMAEDVVAMESIDTLQGSPLTIDTSDGVMVDGATVIITDVTCSNGVIHVIDAVMIPPEA